VQRFIEDPALRENVRTAFDAARHAYKRMSNGKGPAKALVEDKKLQRDLREASESLREAAGQLSGKRRRRKKSRAGRRLFMLLIIGAAVALALSEDARKLVLDRLFGEEEEFEYSSTTTPASS
jgi:CHASE3 domain sensor protein